MPKPTPDSDLQISRRGFLKSAAGASAFALAPDANAAPVDAAETLPPAFSRLKPLESLVHPITADEFQERLMHVQKLMSALVPKFDALFFAPGTSLYYFTGIRWGVSERLLGLIVPRAGAPVLVVPGFEEGRLREKLRFPIEVRVWQEDESPTKIAAGRWRSAAFERAGWGWKRPRRSRFSIICARRRRGSNVYPPIRSRLRAGGENRSTNWS